MGDSTSVKALRSSLNVFGALKHRFGSWRLSFRHWNRHGLAGPAFGDPNRIAIGLDGGRCLESLLDYRDAGFVAVDSNHGKIAAAVLGRKQFAISCAHAIRPFHGD